MQHVTKNVYARTNFQGCNSGFIVTKEGAVVIDTPMVPVEAREWKQEIEKHAPVKYIIINEAHTDHYCGSCYLGGTLIGTEDSLAALKSARVEDLIRDLSWMAPDSPKPDESFFFRTPEIILDGEATLSMGDHSVKILSVPGHTPKQLAVYAPEERVVFTSDNINLAIPIFFNALPDEWLKSLDRLNALDVDHVVPGHGEVTDKSAFRIMQDSIGAWIDVIGRELKEGSDLDETKKKVKEAKEFAGIPKEGPMAGFFYMNVESLYKSLTKKFFS